MIDELFVEREMRVQGLNNFVRATNAAGICTRADIEHVQNERQEIGRMTNQIKDALSKPTSEPILSQPVRTLDELTFTGGKAISRGEQRVSGAYGGGYRAEFLNAFRTNFRQVTNTLQESVDASGGYLVPAEWDERIVTALGEENVIRKISRVIQTSGQHNIPVQASAPVASWIGEGEEISLTSTTFSQTTLGAYKVAAAVKCSNELLADAAYNVEDFVMAEFTKCVGGAEEDAFLNGDGNGKPVGILTSMANVSSTTITTAGNSLSADDLINLVHAVARPYRKNGAFLTNDSTLSAIRKLKDSTQNFLWQQSLQAGEPERLLGYPIFTSAFMPEIASGKIVVLFGDFAAGVTVAQRGTTTARALYELLALRDMSAFLLIERVDCKLVDFHAIRGLKMKG